MRAVSQSRFPNRLKLGGWRLFIAWFALIAFAQQSYVTQTHIHFAPGSFATATLAKSDAGKMAVHKPDQRQTPDKYPANDDPANCPICQEIATVGHFVTPVVLEMALPAQIVSVAALVLSEPEFVSAFSHSWQGRAPPSL